MIDRIQGRALGRVSRRRLLTAGGSALVAGLAGCVQSLEPGSEGAETDGSDESEGESEKTGDEVEPYTPPPSEADAVFLSVETDGEPREAVTRGQIRAIGDVERGARSNGQFVAIELTEAGATDLVETLDAVDAFEDPTGTTLLTHVDDETTQAHTLGADLANAMTAGEYDGAFRASFAGRENATAFRDELTS